MDPWDLIAAERRALADLLEGLTPEQWATPSLCEGWTVKDVAAHTMVGPTAGLPEFALSMLKALGRFHRANQILVERRAALTTYELVGLLREHAENRFTPPGYGWEAPLTDILVHREDIAIPLGLPQDRPAESWKEALDFLVRPKTAKAFGAPPVPPVHLVADDVDWSHGAGPEVRGSATALGVTLCGRDELIDRLTGDGVGQLRS